jgi:ATP-dependent protease Clp ATPase subunit
MNLKRPEVNQVFTPRNSEVNREIYISRPNHERELIRALQGSLHCLIFGHSGTGKSWLYKKILKDLDAHFVIANCANASRLGSITEEVFISVMPTGTKELQGL